MMRRCQKCGRSYEKSEREPQCPHPLRHRDAEMMSARRRQFQFVRHTHVVVGDHTPEPRR